MTKEDYNQMVLKVIVMVKTKGALRILDDILFALRRIPDLEDCVAEYFFNSICNYFDTLTKAQNIPSPELISEALGYALVLSEYHTHAGDNGYDRSVSLMNYEDTQHLVHWYNCENSLRLLNEKQIITKHGKEIEVIYTLKNPKNPFNAS